MRDIHFWLDKYDKAVYDFFKNHGLAIHYNSYLRPFKGLKLKKLYGHGLNEQYTGWKIHRRRNKWLKNRLAYTTLVAKHKQECKRLARTKLSFYLKKLENFGWTPTERPEWMAYPDFI